MTSKKSEVEGELLHAKHALQPNSLGYCGPDENNTILEHLHNSSVSERLTSTLTKFEAAYPFVRLIAGSNGLRPFDRDVTEAYWIGNPLLDRVQPSDFLHFIRSDLGSSRKRAGKMDGIPNDGAKALFSQLGPLAKPHHSFYVLGMYARSTPKAGSEEKLVDLMDSCRVSWGRVLEVKKKTLVVNRPALTMSGSALSLSRPVKKEVHYDSAIPSFARVRQGDWVSLHWNFASETLSQGQLRNLRYYTALDIKATNRIALSLKRPDRR